MKNKKRLLTTIGMVMAPMLLGSITAPIVSHQLNSSVKAVPSNAVDLTSVIPAGSEIGTIQITAASDRPNETQILGAINIWIQGKAEEPNWHINQVHCSDITPIGCTVSPYGWSPDYTTTITTTVAFITQAPTTKQSLRDALAFTGSGAVNLNDKFAGFLNSQDATNIDSLKGDVNKVALLRYLDSASLYAGVLDINQIDVTSSLVWVANSNYYTFTINAKANSNVYLDGALQVTFTVGRTLINSISGLNKVLNFTITPSVNEVYSQFIYNNSSSLIATNLPVTDFTWGTIDSTGVTFSVSGNEYYYTNADVALTWQATVPQALSSVITNTNLGQLSEKPQDNDTIKYLVSQANPSVDIHWNDIVIGSISDTSVTLTPKAGSIYYTTASLDLIWTILS